MSMRSRRLYNKRAGASLYAQKKTGKHTGKRWKPGDNWTRCQRCGKDIYESDAREDGYQEGLIVCPICYDPPHPQDYIRIYPEDQRPGPLSTGDTGDDYSRVGAEGSTEIPAATFGGPDKTP